MGKKKYWLILLLLGLFVFWNAFQRPAAYAVTQSTHVQTAGHAAAPGHGGGHTAASGHGDSHGAHNAHHEEASKQLTPTDSPIAWLPLLCILLPILGGCAVVVCHRSDFQRNIIVVGTVLLTGGMLIAMYQAVVPGIHLNGQLFKGIYASLNYLPGFPLTFKVDPAALTVCLVTVFLWLLSGIYAISYMTIEEKRPRYEFFMLATLGADLGVMLAGDFLTLFICFESLLIFPYALIAHKENPGALRGANMCFYLGSAASLGLLCAIALLGSYTGNIAIAPMAAELAKLPGYLRYIITALMIIGFGGKAGLFLEHVWLPNAHPVAPTPASCLLSGAMIKAGAYGIFRVACTLFAPPQGIFAAAPWVNMRFVGYAVIWVGIIGMFLAVLSALITANSKRMLAFHSVSQMGYIVMGIGCAAYLGPDGAMGFAGALYHIVNHAIFKAALFLGVGAVYYRTHELDMYKLGGLWRNMPVVCVGLFIAACGIAGIPGFNGFASKTLLHHAIIEAYEHSAHYSANGQPDFKLRIAEVIFMITAGGTFASNMKLFALTFLRKRPEKYEDVLPAPLPMRIAIVMVSTAILFIGLNPNWMLEYFIGPALAYFNYNPTSHPYHLIYNTHALPGAMHSIIPILYPIGKEIADAASQVTHNLLGGGTAVMMGGMYFIIGLRFGLFHIVVPQSNLFEQYYLKAYHGFKWVCINIISTASAMIDPLLPKLLIDTWQPLTFPLFEVSKVFDRLIPSLFVDLWLPLTKPISKISGAFENAITGAAYKVGYREEKTTPWIKMPFSGHKRSRFIDRFIDGVEEKLQQQGDEIRFKFEFHEKKSGATWQMLAAALYLAFSKMAAIFDKEVIDGVVNGFSQLIFYISKFFSLFDKYVIDGAVNEIASVVDYFSGTFRRIQTGAVQNYLMAMLVGLIAIVTLFLIKVLGVGFSGW
ncbi:MAG: hypothetical protein HZA78_06670 [Candidatus Schekmanbacteria bacterium]|nr:hypothetical protein [Candidatus Schekmanbacteria bacterium]